VAVGRIAAVAGAAGPFFALGLSGAALAQSAPPPTEPVEGITLQTTRLRAENGRGRVFLNVISQRRDTVDVDIVCEFMKGGAPVMRGSNTITRLAPRRSEPLVVESTREQVFDTARCRVDRIQP
jgi:hypothetical protein